MTTLTHRRWSALDELMLRAGYEDGASDGALAGQLGRTSVAIREKRKRLGLRVRDRHTLSAATVARIMGVRCPKTVASWVRRGWLTPLGGRRVRPWRFDPLALWDLVTLPEAVVAWVPERIADAELRAYGVEQRALLPRWLRLREVACRYHVTPGTVAAWVAQGRFAAEYMQRYGGIWLRADALDGWVAPCERPIVRYRCCGRRLPTGAERPPASYVLVCARCWPTVRMLPGGHLLRFVPPAQRGRPTRDAAVVDRERSAA